MSKYVRIPKSAQRMLLTDVLPYERPLFFSNRFFSRFVRYYDVHIENGELVAFNHTNDTGLKEFLQLISGNKSSERISFSYTISKDGHEKGRTLTIPHPFRQIELMEFYAKYDYLIIDFCNRSNFSLRHPVKVATHWKKRKEFAKVISDEAEEFVSNEDIKHYFRYSRIDNISKFYNDRLYLNVEQDFPYLCKVDIEKCFDSINPTLLPRLLFGDEGVRTDSNAFIRLNMAQEFALLQQHLSNSESLLSNSANTSGIIIGPEFSRLFAEMVLQQIDLQTEIKLKERYGLIHPSDYRFFRYVDDSFIFTRDLESLNKIIDTYRETLRDNDLHLKDKKIELFTHRPFLSPVSEAKDRLMRMVEDMFENRLATFKGFVKYQEGGVEFPVKISSRDFIIQLRHITSSILGVHNTKANVNSTLKGESEPNDSSPYKDVTAYLLSILRTKFHDFLRRFNDLFREYTEGHVMMTNSSKGNEHWESFQLNFIGFCRELIKLIFFVLSSDLKMATTINVIATIDDLQRFLRGKYIFQDKSKSLKFPSECISEVDEAITEETSRLLRHRQPTEFGMMELLNLLELQNAMYPRNRITEALLCKFIDKSIKACGGDCNPFNFFTIFQLLHFTKGKKQYSAINDYIQPWIEDCIKRVVKSKGNDGESLFVIIELLSGSYDDMKALINEFSEEGYDWNKISLFLYSNRDMFISWHDFDLHRELVHLKNVEVY